MTIDELFEKIKSLKKIDKLKNFKNGRSSILFLLAKYEAKKDNSAKILTIDHVSNATKYIKRLFYSEFEDILKQFAIRDQYHKTQIDLYIIENELIDYEIEIDRIVKEFFEVLDENTQYYIPFLDHNKFIAGGSRTSNERTIRDFLDAFVTCIDNIEDNNKGSFNYFDRNLKYNMHLLCKYIWPSSIEEWKYYIIDLILQLESNYPEAEVIAKVEDLFEREYFNKRS